MSDPVVLLSTGDVVGPAGGVTDNSMVLFSGTSGKLIKGNNAVVTAAGLALLDDVNAAAQRTTLGLGTAATATLTTSATDTTADRVLKVGDFGLGTTAVHYGGDLNLLGNVTGFYRTILGATNFPNGCMDSCFVHIGSGDTYSQTIVGYNNNRMYTRGGVGVVPNISWQTWREIALTDSPAFTGTPTAPTAPVGTGTTQLATTAFVTAADNLKADVATTLAGYGITDAYTKVQTDDVARPLALFNTISNVSTSRAIGVTYTNNTGRAIIANIFFYSASAGMTSMLSVNGVMFYGTSYNAVGYYPGTFIIPAGAQYFVPSGTYTLKSWVEVS